MNNKKTWLISIAVLVGITLYILHDRNAREDLTPPAADHQGGPASEHPASAPLQAGNPDQPPAIPPLEPGIRAGLEEILDTSSEGLEEQEVDGTASINLQGRFRTAPVATIGADGEIHIEEYSRLPDEGSQ